MKFLQRWVGKEDKGQVRWATKTTFKTLVLYVSITVVWLLMDWFAWLSVMWQVVKTDKACNACDLRLCSERTNRQTVDCAVRTWSALHIGVCCDHTVVEITGVRRRLLNRWCGEWASECCWWQQMGGCIDQRRRLQRTQHVRSALARHAVHRSANASVVVGRAAGPACHHWLSERCLSEWSWLEFRLDCVLYHAMRRMRNTDVYAAPVGRSVAGRSFCCSIHPIWWDSLAAVPACIPDAAWVAPRCIAWHRRARPYHCLARSGTHTHTHTHCAHYRTGVKIAALVRY